MLFAVCVANAAACGHACACALASGGGFTWVNLGLVQGLFGVGLGF